MERCAASSGSITPVRSREGAGIVISLEHVTKVYEGAEHPAVDDLTLEVPEGEVDRAHRPVGLRQVHDASHDQPARSSPTPARSCSTAETFATCDSRSSAAASATRSRASACSRTGRCTRTSGSCRGCSGGTSHASTRASTELLELVGLDPERYDASVPRRAVRRRGAAGRASRERSPPTRRCC